MAKLLSTAVCLSLLLWWAPSSAEETEKEATPAPSDALPDPASIEMADTVAASSEITLGMFNCTNRETVEGKANLVCFFVLTQKKYAYRKYTVKKLIAWKPQLSDNLGVEHEFITSYFLNRRGQQLEEVNLAKGESSWFVAEFAGGGLKDVTSARVVFTKLPDDPLLKAPVKPLE